MLSDVGGVGGVASVLDVQSLFFFIKENRICAMTPGLLYHLTRCDSGRFVNETFTSNPIVSSKQ